MESGALDILLAICNATPDIVATASASGTPTFLNQSGLRFFGLSQDTPLDAEFFRRVQPEWAYRKVVDEGFPLAAQHGSWSAETALLGPNGEEVPVSQVILSHPGIDGREGFFSTILRDISEIKRAHTELEESQRMVRKVADATLEMLYIIELPTHKLLYANLRFDEVLGIQSSEQPVIDLETLKGVVHPDDFDALCQRTDLVAMLPDGEVLESELRIRKGDDEWRWLNIRTAVFHRDPATGTTQVLSSAHDVSARKRADAEERELRRVMENALEGVARLDAAGKHLYANASYSRMCGLSGTELEGRCWEEYVHPFDRVEMSNQYLKMRTDGRAEGECRGQRPDGTVYYKRVVLIATHDLHGRIAGHYCFASDVTDRRGFELQMRQQMQALTEYSLQLETKTAELAAANRMLENLAQNDGLTGVPNHRTLQDRLRQEYARSDRNEKPLAFLLLDIDHFKAYNDANGHPEGDEVLRMVAALLTSEARTSDVVARYGGEEFAVILPDTDLEAALVIAERFRAVIESHEWRLRTITTSIGLAVTTQFDSSPGALIEAADKALYTAKREGRNRVCTAVSASDKAA